MPGSFVALFVALFISSSFALLAAMALRINIMAIGVALRIRSRDVLRGCLRVVVQISTYPLDVPFAIDSKTFIRIHKFYSRY